MGLGLYLHRLFYLDLDSYYLEVQVTWIWSVWTGNWFWNHKSILPESNLLSNIAKLELAGKNQGSFLAPVDKWTGCGARGKMFKWCPPSAARSASTHGWGPGARLRALGGVQGQSPWRGSRGRSPRKLSGFSIFECLWRALRYLIILKQMNYFWTCFSLARSFFGWIYIWWVLKYVISFFFGKKMLKIHTNLSLSLVEHFGGGCKGAALLCLWENFVFDRIRSFIPF